MRRLIQWICKRWRERSTDPELDYDIGMGVPYRLHHEEH